MNEKSKQDISQKRKMKYSLEKVNRNLTKLWKKTGIIKKVSIAGMVKKYNSTAK